VLGEDGKLREPCRHTRGRMGAGRRSLRELPSPDPACTRAAPRLGDGNQAEENEPNWSGRVRTPAEHRRGSTDPRCPRESRGLARNQCLEGLAGTGCHRRSTLVMKGSAVRVRASASRLAGISAQSAASSDNSPNTSRTPPERKGPSNEGVQYRATSERRRTRPL
jgi:hypothetical protein